MSATTILLLTAALAAPQGTQGKGRLRLPPAQPAASQPPQEPVVTRGELERFRQRLGDYGATGEQPLLVLEAIDREFLDKPQLLRQAARTAVGREMASLAAVAERFGTPAVGQDLALQLQVRKLGRAAVEPVVQAVRRLLGDDAKDVLFQLVRARDSLVRTATLDHLAEMVDEGDLQVILSFAHDRSIDARRTAVRLLAAVDSDEARARLVELLSAHRAKDLSICAEACEALCAQGEAAVPVLLRALAEPPVDHAWFYSAFALAHIERSLGRDLLQPEHAAPLMREIKGADALSRSLAAVPLARLHWRGAVQPADDAAVVEALLAVAAPQGYISNLAMLQGPTDAALVALSGREAPESRLAWRAWWEGASTAFVPMRRTLSLADDQYGRAQLRLQRGDSELRIHGETLAEVVVGVPGRDLLVTAEQLEQLLAELERAGFQSGRLDEQSPGLERVRSLEVRVDGLGHRVAAPAQGAPWFDRLAAIVDEIADGERWQFYRGAEKVDFDTFWRSERAWLAEHPDPAQRNARLADRILAAWPTLDDPRRRADAVSTLLGLPDVRDLIDETRGAKLLDLVSSADTMGDFEFRLLELAMAAPGDVVWRRGLDLIDAQLEKGLVGDAGAERASAVSQIFALMGPERVLEALRDPRKRVRLGAIDEVVALRLREAGPALIEALGAEDGEIRRASVYALGALRVADARDPIVGLANEETTPGYLREECLIALGRLGGEGVVELLESVMALDDFRLKEAAVRGLGEMQDPQASVVLADLFAARYDDALGALCRNELLRHGALRANPALRFELQRARQGSGESRRALLMLLGELQDASVVGDLYPLLAEVEGTAELQLVRILEDTTGLDIGSVNDRLIAMESWYSKARFDTQGTWLIRALDAVQFPHTLTPPQVAPGAGLVAVPELARIMESAPLGRIRVLASAVLRDLAQADFGRVTRGSTPERLAELARRYRFLAEVNDRDPTGK